MRLTIDKDWRRVLSVLVSSERIEFDSLDKDDQSKMNKLVSIGAVESNNKARNIGLAIRESLERNKQANKNAKDRRESKMPNSTRVYLCLRSEISKVFKIPVSKKPSVKDRALANKLVDTYGMDDVLGYIVWTCANWDDVRRNIRNITGVPSVSVLWSFRDSIYPMFKGVGVSVSGDFKEGSDDDIGW